jgi:hypothetical protein
LTLAELVVDHLAVLLNVSKIVRWQSQSVTLLAELVPYRWRVENGFIPDQRIILFHFLQVVLLQYDFLGFQVGKVLVNFLHLNRRYFDLLFHMWLVICQFLSTLTGYQLFLYLFVLHNGRAGNVHHLYLVASEVWEINLVGSRQVLA